MLLPGSVRPARTAPPARQWFALVAPPIAWSVHELSSTWLSSALCRAGRPGPARVALLGMTLLALAITVAGVVVAGAAQRAAGRDDQGEGRARDELLALAGVFVGVVFSVAIVWGGLPALVLGDLCEARE